MTKDYFVNPIILKDEKTYSENSNTIIFPVQIMVTGKVIDISVYTSNKKDMLANDIKGLPGEFKSYTKTNPLLLGDMKKGKKNAKRFFIKAKKISCGERRCIAERKIE